MELKDILNSLKVEHIKKIIKIFNLETRIKVSGRKKSELIDDLIKHTTKSELNTVLTKLNTEMKALKKSYANEKEKSKEKKEKKKKDENKKKDAQAIKKGLSKNEFAALRSLMK